MKKEIIKYSALSTDIGNIFIATTDKGICRLTIGTNEKDFIKELKDNYNCEAIRDDNFIKYIVVNIKDYFSKKTKIFNCKIDFLEGTNFQKKVWKKLTEIPFGETRTYKWIAQQIEHENAYRAVGNANSKNPIVLIVPCHRVIKEDGTLGGFSLGVWRKEFLLRLEAVI